ncbi:MAG: DUF1513 domain-containing protein [Paracoccaceae bacterium]
MTSRRSVLAGLAALCLPAPSWADVGSPRFLAAAKQGEAYRLHGLTAEGESLFSLPLPARGHAATAHPDQPLAVAFARRPGVFALVLDCRDGRLISTLTPPPGRQFNGHGAFSADGEVLYTSEVIADTSEGRVGLWDTRRFTRIGEVPSGGIGPHDMKRLPDGSLVIANGGIATDPRDRTKLNIPDMRPNLTLLSQDGAMRDQAALAPALNRNSIRHLALARDGSIAFAMQWEGDAAETVPLLGLWSPGQSPILCPAPETEQPRMQGYAGSIAVATDGRIGLTSPRGGLAQVFAPDGRFLASHARPDICGLAALPTGGFLASDGMGALLRITDEMAALHTHPLAWDNHIVTLA